MIPRGCPALGLEIHGSGALDHPPCSARAEQGPKVLILSEVQMHSHHCFFAYRPLAKRRRHRLYPTSG